LLTPKPSQRDLAENGGLLDEVHWVANTDNVEDLQWLDDVLIPSSASYRKISMEETRGAGNYGSLWNSVEAGNLYIKLDDDMVSCVPLALGRSSWCGRQADSSSP
jgi:hypothetical protein